VPSSAEPVPVADTTPPADDSAGGSADVGDGADGSVAP
jgi:hypothetical protein